MELKDAIKNRQSIREYQDKPVPENKLHNVLEAAASLLPVPTGNIGILLSFKTHKNVRHCQKQSGGQPSMLRKPL